jgi:hypothetical protein
MMFGFQHQIEFNPFLATIVAIGTAMDNISWKGPSVGCILGRMNGPFSRFAIGQTVAISIRMRALSGGIDARIVISLSEILRTLGGSEQDDWR